MPRLRHLTTLLGDLLGFAKAHRAYWLVPFIVLLLLAGLLVFAGQGATPFLYTLF